MPERVEIYASRRKYALLLAGSLAFVAIGAVAVVVDPEARTEWWAWASIVFFGACAVAFVHELRNKRPRVVIDRDGIAGRGLPRKLRWDEIEEIFPTSVSTRGGRQHFLGIVPKDPEIASRGSTWRGFLAKANEQMVGAPVNVPTSHMRRKPEEIWQEVERLAPPEIVRRGADG